MMDQISGVRLLCYDLLHLQIISGQKLVIIIALVWLDDHLIRISTNLLTQQNYFPVPLDLRSAKIIQRVLRISLVMIALLMSLQIFGVGISSLLAFGGVVGLAVGLAVNRSFKEIFTDFLGSIVIFSDQLFSEGDWIKFPEQNLEGTVEKIGWRSTRIRTFEKVLLVIPNALFNQIIIKNMSRMTHRRIQMTIGIKYENMNAAKIVASAIEKILKTYQSIDQNELIWSKLNNINENTIDVEVSAYTQLTSKAEFQALKQQLLLLFSQKVEELGGEIAYSTQAIVVNHSPSIEI